MAGGGKGPDNEKMGDGCRRGELISALDHPARRQILRLMLDRSGRLSAVEAARELNMPLGGVSYHVRLLRERHAIAPAGTRRVRGAIQRFFKVTIEDDPPIETLLEETREADEACAGKGRRKPRKRGKRK